MDVYTIIILLFFNGRIEVVDIPYQFPNEEKCVSNMVSVITSLYQRGVFREILRNGDELTKFLPLCVVQTEA